MVVVLLLGSFVIYGIYTSIFYSLGHQCALRNKTEVSPEYQCAVGWQTGISLGNKDFKRTYFYERVSLCITFAYVLILRIASYALARKTDSHIDQQQQTPSDYTLMIRDIPLGTTGTQLVKLFNDYYSDLENKGKINDGEQLSDNGGAVQKINFAYYIADFIELSQQKGAIKVKIATEKSLPESERNQKKLDKYKTQLKTLAEKNRQIFKQSFSNSKDLNNTLFTGVCFVSFKTMYAKEIIYQGWKTSVLKKLIGSMTDYIEADSKKINGKRVLVENCPEPFDLNWENIGYPWQKKLRSRIIGTIIVIILVAISFGCIFGIKIFQQSYLKDHKDSMNIYVGYAVNGMIALVISLINVVIGQAIWYITLWEKYSTHTRFQINIMRRISMATFLNSTLILLIVNYFIHKDKLQVKLWAADGLIADAWSILLFNIFLGPFNKVVDFMYMYKLLQRWWLLRQGDENTWTQVDANLIFEGKLMYLSYDYVSFQTTLMICFFFLPILPMSLLLGAVAGIVFFVTNKYLIFYRNKQPNSTGPKLCFSSFHFLDAIICIIGLSQLLFDYILKDKSFGTVSIVIAVIGILNYFFGLHYIYTIIFSFKNQEHLQKNRNNSYNDRRLKFITEYDRCNPITKVVATKQFLLFQKRNFNLLTTRNG